MGKEKEMETVIRNEENEIISVKGYKIGDIINYSEGAGDTEKMYKGVMKKIVDDSILIKIYIDKATEEDVVFTWQIVQVSAIKEKEITKQKKIEAKQKAVAKRAMDRMNKKTQKEDAIRMNFMKGTLEIPKRVSMSFINKVIPNGYKIEKHNNKVYKLNYIVSGNSLTFTYTSKLSEMLSDIKKEGFSTFIKNYQD
jgi:hypothetical protein